MCKQLKNTVIFSTDKTGVSSAHQGCIYLTKNTVKLIVTFLIFEGFSIFEFLNTKIIIFCIVVQTLRRLCAHKFILNSLIKSF